MGALSVTGNAYLRAAAGMPLQDTTPMPFDGYFGEDIDTIAYLEKVLADPSSGMDDSGGRDPRDRAGRGRPQRGAHRVAASGSRRSATSAASC